MIRAILLIFFLPLASFSQTEYEEVQQAFDDYLASFTFTKFDKAGKPDISELKSELDVLVEAGKAEEDQYYDPDGCDDPIGLSIWQILALTDPVNYGWAFGLALQRTEDCPRYSSKMNKLILLKEYAENYKKRPNRFNYFCVRQCAKEYYKYHR